MNASNYGLLYIGIDVVGIGRTRDGDRRIVDSELIEFQRGKAVPETFVDGAVQWSELKYHRRWRFSLVHGRIF